MSTYRDLPLRDVASAGELARRVLERAGIDYCCHGGETLQRACDGAGLDVSAIERELGERGAGPSEDWAHRGVTELVDHIAGAVHERTRRLLEELVAARAELPQADGRARALGEAIDLLAAHAELQMIQEERGLLARTRALAEARKGRGPFPTSLRTVHEHRARLRAGHATTHDLLRRARTLAEALDGPGFDRLRARLDAVFHAMAEQIHLENNELVPRALDLEPNGREGS